MKRFELRTQLAVALVTVGLLSTACTKENHTHVFQVGTGQSINQYLSIPMGIQLDGINSVSFYSTEEGLVIQSEDTSAVAVSPGAFFGGGLGNKAFVGIKNQGGQLVSTISSIEFQARLDRGVSQVYLNLLVDCNGDGDWTNGEDAIVTSDSSVHPAFNLTAGIFSSVRVDAIASVWMSVGAVCGLPSHLGSVGAPLTDLPAGAKLFDGVINDGGMPRDTSMYAINFLQGDSGTRTSKQVTLREFKVNSTAYSFVDVH